MSDAASGRTAGSDPTAVPDPHPGVDPDEGTTESGTPVENPSG